MLSDKARQLRLKLSELFPLLNERQRRALAASEANAYGRGGITVVARITGMSRQTIYRGKEELGHIDAPERVRRPGGGRKKLAEKMPDVLEALEDLVPNKSRGPRIALALDVQECPEDC